MPLTSILATVALGTAIGAVGGLFGIGGGLIAISVLGLAYGMSQQTAQGTALVMVVPAVLFAFWRYRQRVALDLRIAVTLALTAAPSTYVTAGFAIGLDGRRLRVSFAIFILLMAAVIASYLLRSRVSLDRRAPPGWWWSASVGIAGGIVSGLFGVGGAIVAPPALTALFGMRQAAAQGLALALVAPGSAVALFAYARAGQVQWAAGIPLAIGALASLSAGVAAAHRLPERGLRLLFCGFLAATAALLIWRA